MLLNGFSSILNITRHVRNQIFVTVVTVIAVTLA